MYDKTSLKIMELIYVNPGIHKRELSKQLKLGMPSIDYGLKKITKLTISKKSGNQINYFLNYSNKAITPALYNVEFMRMEKLPAKIRITLMDFIKELKEKPLIVILFGSYAKGNYTKTSDIDILLVFQKIIDVKKIEFVAKKISMRTNTNLNAVYLDYSNFRESFHNPTKRFFKNLKENKILLTGIEWWRQLKNEEA